MCYSCAETDITEWLIFLQVAPPRQHPPVFAKLPKKRLIGEIPIRLRPVELMTISLLLQRNSNA